MKMAFFEIQASRIRVARLFLSVGVLIGIAATISSFHSGMDGEALGGLFAVLITPIALWLSTKPKFKYLPNIVSVFISAAFSIGSALTMLDHAEGMVWLGVTPIMYFYLSNRYIGIFFASMTFVIFIFSYIFYPNMHGIEPVKIGVFSQAMSVFLYATLLAWLYESEWTGKYNILRRYTDFDYLTDIYNRRAIARSMDSALSELGIDGSHMSVILFDLDNFKSVNDTYGHDVGDSVLKEMAELIRGNIRRGDIFGRWGGEEFVIVTKADASEAMDFAEKIRGKISQHDFKNIRQLTASFGVAEYKNAEGVSGIMNRVDANLYEAKRCKNSVVGENGRSR